MKNHITSIILTTVLAGCSGSSGDSEPAATTPQATTPQATTPQATTPQATETGAIKGLDTNANNIRDDVDQLIAQKFSSTPEIKKAAEQKAAALQNFMEANNKEEATSAANNVSRASACVRTILPGAGNQQTRLAISKEIESQTVNSTERQTKYLDSNTLASGTYLPEPVQPVCD